MSIFDDFYEEWTDLPLGLEYSRDGDIVHYRPTGAFYVDGIRYDPDAHKGPAFRRPMVQAMDMRDVRGADMCHSRPPTDAELDHYVRTGNFDGRLMT